MNGARGDLRGDLCGAELCKRVAVVSQCAWEGARSIAPSRPPSASCARARRIAPQSIHQRTVPLASTGLRFGANHEQFAAR